jgi:hypothetical protein
MRPFLGIFAVKIRLIRNDISSQAYYTKYILKLKVLNQNLGIKNGFDLMDFFVQFAQIISIQRP